MSSNYTKQNGDTSPVFDHIVRSGYPLRMLVYSGDLDTVCNFIGGLLFSPSNIDKSGSLVYLVSYKGHSAKHK